MSTHTRAHTPTRERWEELSSWHLPVLTKILKHLTPFLLRFFLVCFSHLTFSFVSQLMFYAQIISKTLCWILEIFKWINRSLHSRSSNSSVILQQEYTRDAWGKKKVVLHPARSVRKHSRTWELSLLFRYDSNFYKLLTRLCLRIY